MAEWVSALERWQDTKTKFQEITGEKKPTPKGFLAKTFGHTGLTKALTSADSAVAKLQEAQYMPEGEKRTRALEKAFAEGDKVLKSLKKECGSYMNFLEREAEAEKAEERVKTPRYRAIKMLKAELDQIIANFDQTFDGVKVTSNPDLTVNEKYAQMTKKALASACKSAASAIKKVKAEPTAATYNGLFHTEDSPGRKISVQMVQAIRFGLPSGSVDATAVKEMFEDWKTVNSPKAQIANNATENQVLGWIKDFSDAVKYAVRYCDELE